MSELFIYLNERCLPVDFSDEAIRSDGLRRMISTFEMTIERHKAARIGVLHSHWHGPNEDLPLSEQIRTLLSNERTRYQRLMKKITFVSLSEIDGGREIHYERSAAVGLGLADLAASKWSHGWTLSYGADAEKWRRALLPAERYLLDDAGNLIGPTECEIWNLATPEHVEKWDQELRDWGEVVAPSSILDHIGGHPIVMYAGPKEHNPPHVHLRVSPSQSGDIAKYRISDGIREKGIPKWDTEMKEWISKYREQLLKSWERCQRGGHPYKLR